VHAEHGLGAARHFGDLRDRDRRGVRGEHAGGLHALLDIEQDSALELEVLEHGFDHEVAVFEAAVRLCAGHPAHHSLGLEAAQTLALDVFGQQAMDVREPSANRRIVDLVQAHRQVHLGSGDVSDAAAHQTATEDA
jgi:hypothetical protein